MAKRQDSIEPVNIKTQEAVTQLCGECRREGRFAFDTEFVMEDRYEPEACLLQLATSRSVFLIDPFLELDLQPVWQLVADPDVETVVHAGQEDLALAVQHTGCAPCCIFDVQIAAGFAGMDYPMSLMKLVQATRHIRLHKSKTLTDWRRRPLTDAQLRYGAEDVAHLLAAADLLHDRLSKLGRVEWVREELGKYERLSLYEREEEDKIARVKGAGALSGKHLAIVRELLAWRETIAARYNRPARALLKDHLLVEIARHQLCTFGDIRDLRGLNLRDADVRGLAAAVTRAQDSPPAQWPQAKPRSIETPDEAVLTALVTAVVRSYCVEHSLAYGLVASQRSIRELIRYRTFGRPADPADIELLRGWRGRTVGVMVDQVLAGQRDVRVEPVDGKLAVHVTPAIEEA